MAQAAVAKAKYLRLSFRKAILVLDLIRGKTLAEARRVLVFSPKRASTAVSKVLESAAANAKVKGLSEGSLVVAKAAAGQGPTLKRMAFAARGRTRPLLKRTSHIVIELSGRV